MITNGEVTVNRRRRAGDYEHNDVTVKLSFTMDGISNEEAFRCSVVDQAVKLAMLGLSTPNAASAADTSSLVPAPDKTAGSRQRQPKPAEITAATAPEAPVTQPATVSPAPAEAPPVPPTPPAVAPIAPPPALGNGALNGASASPSIPSNTGTGATPVVIGLPPSPPTVPAPAVVASPSAAPALTVVGGERYADKAEFQKALVAQVTRINGVKPGQGGLLVNQVIARFVAPPNGAGAIPVEQREAFMAEVEAIQ